MASKVLTATVRLNISPAEKALKRLNKQLNLVNRGLNKASGTNLTKQLTKANTQANKLQTALNKASTAQHNVTKSVEKTNSQYHKSNSLLSTMNSKLKAIASTYLGIMGMKAVTKLTDTMIGSENKLNYTNSQLLGGKAYDSSGNYSTAVFEATDDSFNKMYTSSQKVRMGYADMMANVSKSMVLAGGAFQNNIDNAIRFQEIMAEAYAIGGATSAEMHTSMYQMMQALGGNLLAGDELRSVREGAPLAYQAIETFAQGLFNSTDSLKELASQGKITADVVVSAIMNAGEKMDDVFSRTKITFAQTGNQIKNAAFKAFLPIADKLSEILSEVVNSGLIDKLFAVFSVIGKVLLFVFEILIGIANFIADNWSWISAILIAIGTIIAISLIPKLISMIQFVAFAIYYYTWLGATAVASAIKSAVAWAIAHWQITLIILAIVALIAVIVWLTGSVEGACGVIVGAVMTLVAAIWNTVVGVINAIIQYLWTRFVEPFMGIIEWILNASNGGFNGVLGGLANFAGQIISIFLSLGKVVTTIIDAIAGTDWTEKLTSLQNKVLAWGKKEDAITINREAPSLKDIGVDRWAYGDAYDTGYNWGYSAANAISGGLSDLLNVDNQDYGLNVDFDDSNLLNGIKNDTGSMKDAMDLTNEELEYLRKIAEMEWRNEFTTAEIKVEMTNNNTVNGERDLDGIMEYLSESLREEMSNVAYGVHY